MLAGNLRDSIDIYVKSDFPNTYGNKEKTYSYSFTERAESYFQSASEGLAGQIQHANKSMKFRVRWRHNRYFETQVVKFLGDYYNITGIDIDRHHEFIFLTASRVPSGTITIVEPTT